MENKITLEKIILISLTIFIGACSNTSKEIKKTSEKIPYTEVITPKMGRPEYSLDLPGELKPYEQVDIFAKAKGFVKKIYADRGSKIKKGQLLAVLEAPEISQQFLSVKSNERKLYEDYLYSRQAYNRLRTAALKNGAVAEIELDKAKAQLRSDSAAYHSAKASTGASAHLTGYLRIVAPFNGTVIQRNVSAGALVGGNSSVPLFSIAQQEHLRLTLAIPEKHAHSVPNNTLATFTVSNRPGKIYKAKLSRNSALLSPSTRSVMVEFDINNQDLSLSGGEYAQAKVIMQRPDSTLWVPASSVVHAQSGVFILKVEHNRIRRIPVKEGTRKDSLQEIFGEVTQLDKIVQKGTEELGEGVMVRVK